MKKTLLLLLAVLFSFLNYSNAQDASFPMENATWCYRGYGDTGEDLGIDCFSPHALEEVNGKIYAHIGYRPHPYGDFKDLWYREEAGQFFVIPQDSTEEILVYDSNLEVGDTFTVHWGWGIDANNLPFDIEVTYIDTITTLDGVLRKEFTMEGAFGWLHWIEGIGDSEWIFTEPAYVASLSGGYSFACFAIDSMTVYPTYQPTEGCFFSSTENLETYQSVEIFPNPSEGDFFIKNENQLSFQLEILDQLGRVILKHNPSEAVDYFSIPRINGKGIYFVKLTFEDQRILMKKIIKN